MATITVWNQHYYLGVTAGPHVAWTRAHGDAGTLGGHLATIGGVREDGIVHRAARLAGLDDYWIGLSDSAREGVFAWVTGEALTYTGWIAGAPDNRHGTQAAHYVSGNFDGAGGWNDLPDVPGPLAPGGAAHAVDGYVVEWGSAAAFVGTRHEVRNQDNRFLASSRGDVIAGGDGNDTMVALAGADSLHGGAGNDRLLGGHGADTILGGAGIDILFGLDDDDLVLGGTEGDRLLGGNGADTLDGEAGNDVLAGGADDDLLRGGDGGDRMDGGGGNDTILTGSGRNIANGGEGADSLLGGGNPDVLRGGNGADTLAGGGGQDSLSGGAGNDVFRIELPQHSAAAAPDRIGDFADGDRILLGWGVSAASWLGFLAPGEAVADGFVGVRDRIPGNQADAEIVASQDGVAVSIILFGVAAPGVTLDDFL